MVIIIITTMIDTFMISDYPYHHHWFLGCINRQLLTLCFQCSANKHTNQTFSVQSSYTVVFILCTHVNVLQSHIFTLSLALLSFSSWLSAWSSSSLSSPGCPAEPYQRHQRRWASLVKDWLQLENMISWLFSNPNKQIVGDSSKLKAKGGQTRNS